jgi:ankyrin repeat protein
MTVLQKMGRNEEAKKQQAILNAIGKSIMESGDGGSAKTAWFTVFPSETVFFLTEALGAQIEGQELVHVNGHAYDKLTVLDRQGNRRVVWFNTDTNELNKERGMHPNLPASAQENELIAAAGKDDLSRVKALLDNGTDVNEKIERGGTALLRVSYYCYLDVVQTLLSKGAEINAKTNDGKTALMYASVNGHLDVVQVLLAQGAEVNVKESEDGETALMVASQNGHLEIVKALLNKAPDVNATDNLGWTALMWASRNGYLEIVQALLAKGADVNAKNNKVGTALDAATIGKHDEVRGLLLQAGARP